MSKRRKKSKSIIYSNTFSFFIFSILIILLFFLLKADFRLLRNERKISNHLKVLADMKNNLDRVNTNLKRKLNVSLDKDYTETILREKGMYKKADEEAVVVVPSNRNTSSSSMLPRHKINFWQKIREHIKELFH